MAADLEDLIEPLTIEEVRESLLSVLELVGVTTSMWKPGAIVRTIITGFAIVLSAFSHLQAAIVRSGFLETATGVWLTLVAHYVFFVDRIEASQATGVVTLINTAGGLHEIDPEDLIVINTTTGRTYRNTEAISLDPFATLTDVPIIAVEFGSASTSAPGEIDGIETGPVTVTVTNPAAVVGRDAELDPELRTRCYEKPDSLSPNGPKDAYSFFAKSAVRADGSAIGVTRVRTQHDDMGNLTVYVGTATGLLTGDIADPTTDLGKVHDDLQRNVEPLGITETTANATVESIDVSYEVWAYDTIGYTEAQLQQLIETTLTTYISGQPIGGNKKTGEAVGHIFNSALEGIIKELHADIFAAEVTVPAGDYAVASAGLPVIGNINSLGIHIQPFEEL